MQLRKTLKFFEYTSNFQHILSIGNINIKTLQRFPFFINHTEAFIQG